MAEEHADELMVAHLDGRMRAAHGQAPARADMQDAYVGAREDLAIWKRRALEAERDLRAERETASRLAAEINAINGPTHLGEPAPTAQPAPAAADFTTLGAAMRAIQQAIELIGEPADDRMRAVKRVLRGAVIVAEDSGELSAPAAGAVAGPAEPTQEMIDAVLRLVDLEQSDPEDHRHDDGSKLATQICRAVLAAAPTPPTQAADSVLEDAARWQMAALIGNEVMLHPDKRTNPAAVKAYMDAVHSGLDLTGAIDAARTNGDTP